MYSNFCCSCSFEPEIIKFGQSSHKMYSNNILNFQECTTILNVYTKKAGTLLNHVSRWFYALQSNTKSFFAILIIYLHTVQWFQVLLLNISISAYQEFLSNLESVRNK